MQEKDKKKIAERRRKWTVALLILFLCLYIPSFYSWVRGGDIRTDIAKYGSIEDSINIEAYIIREEELLKAPFSGKCVLNYNEGAKVPAGAKVATIYKGEVDDLIRQIEEMEKKIIDAKREKLENDLVFINDMKKINDEIAKNVKRLAAMGNSGNISKVPEIKKNMDELIRKKATITGSLSTSDVYIQSLVSQKAELEKALEAKKEDIVSQTSGVVTYTTDGVEEFFNKDAIYKATSADLEKLNIKTSIFKSGEHVEGMKIYGKIINNVEGYLLACVDNRKKFDLSIDQPVKIRMNEIGNRVINGEVYYLSREEKSGKTVVAVRINKGIDELAGKRKTNIDLIRREISGLKVPVTALRNIDERNGSAEIFTVRYNYTFLKKVKLLGKDTNWAIIDVTDDRSSNSISAYDEYIVFSENMEEGRIVRK